MRMILGLSILCVATLIGCSSSDTTTPSVDAGNGKDSAIAQDSGQDSGAPAINGCGPNDFKAANAITWNFTVSPACVTVKPGDSVTWNGDFTTHPLDAFNGDSPNPITGAGATADGGTSVTVKFTTAGTYGFHCNIHASMLGAVKVAP
jgi:plastocyanin